MHCLRKIRSLPVLAAAAILGSCIHSAAPAAESRAFQWSDWWLPSQHSVHGDGIDVLFNWIFWITMIALILVQGVLVWFLVIYRRKATVRKAHFVHGNTRLEMAWTLMPAVILAVLALASKQVWEGYRHPPVDEKTAQIGVIGEQFKWNVIYPGADGKVGKYLQYPKVSDAKWPHGRRFAQVNGPRELQRAVAIRQINNYIADESPLGKVYDDPQGKDDDWQKDPTRPVLVPVNRLVEVVLGSKDVLHSFSVPNFRVKLDAVPGLVGKIYFTPEVQSTQDTLIDSLTLDARLWIDGSIPTVVVDDELGTAALPDPKNPAFTIQYLQSSRTLVNYRLAAKSINEPTEAQINEEFTSLKNDFKAANISSLPVITTPYEIVCQELCGSGHGTMRGELIVLSEQQYATHIRRNKPAPTDPSSPPQQPRPIASAQN